MFYAIIEQLIITDLIVSENCLCPFLIVNGAVACKTKFFLLQLHPLKALSGVSHEHKV